MDDLLCLGDSITAARGARVSRIAALAWPELIAGDVRVDATVSSTAETVLSEQEFHPADFVTLTIGTNEVVNLDTPLDSYRITLESLARRLRRSGRLIVIDLAARQARMPGRSRHAKLLAGRHELVRSNLLSVFGADLHVAELDDPVCWSSDRVHPTAWGHVQIARLVHSLTGLPLRSQAEPPGAVARTGQRMRRTVSNTRYRVHPPEVSSVVLA